MNFKPSWAGRYVRAMPAMCKAAPRSTTQIKERGAIAAHLLLGCARRSPIFRARAALYGGGGRGQWQPRPRSNLIPKVGKALHPIDLSDPAGVSGDATRVGARVARAARNGQGVITFDQDRTAAQTNEVLEPPADSVRPARAHVVCEAATAA